MIIGAAVLFGFAAAGWFVFRAETTVVADYIAGANGVVVAADTGKPLAGAVVRVRFDKDVFQAITPLREAEVITGPNGEFNLGYLSCGEPGGGYIVTATKDGWSIATAKGVGAGSHRLVLQKRDG